MEYSLNAALHSLRSSAEALAEHFETRGDERGFEMLEELLDAQHMILVLMNDGLRAAREK
ncbi:MAG: hypothetical protein WBW46_00480 [Candidatus Sulfotelmatobacter sp.]